MTYIATDIQIITIFDSGNHIFAAHNSLWQVTCLSYEVPLMT